MREKSLMRAASPLYGKEIMERWRRRALRFKILRLVMIALLVLVTTTSLGVFIYSVSRKIPSTIYFRARQSQNLDLRLPVTGEVRTASVSGSSNVPKGVVIDLSGPVCMQTGGQDSYDMQVRLFGIIPLKKVDIHVIEDQMLIPMGIPVGIYLENQGSMVIGVTQFQSLEGEMVAPAQNLLTTGDVIIGLNGIRLHGKKDLIQEIKECQGNTVILTVLRNGREQTVLIDPVMNRSGEYQMGVWVRDNAQGVGTLTYLDAEGNFGALGHAIADVDTGKIVEVSDGALYRTEIVSLRRGEHGSPGEMTGKIIYDERNLLGNVHKNSDKGVYGKCNEDGMNLATREAVPIALKQEIELGPATILCTIDRVVESFEVEVTKVKLDEPIGNRGIELKVTDPELLRRTGGIVQGMSGSPILQNGKIIGAVTHVLVNSPEKGYGIFIENMLAEGD